MTPEDIAVLRAEHYHAAFIKVIDVHSDLRILRVRPDEFSTGFEPGQCSTLGLGTWEPRVTGVDGVPLADEHQRRLLRRGYSFSCPLVPIFSARSGRLGGLCPDFLHGLHGLPFFLLYIKDN